MDSIENVGVTQFPKPHPGNDVTLLQSDSARMMMVLISPIPIYFYGIL